MGETTLSKKLFRCELNEDVYDCFSQRIDLFDNVLKNHTSILFIINKSKKNDEITSQQINTTIHWAEYLRLTYINVLKMDPEDRYSFEKCCEDAIVSLKSVGIKFINSPKIIMKLNKYFRKNDTFSHPNIQVEMDWTYESPFSETYPEVKKQLREWCTKKLSLLNCYVIRKYITEQIFPKVYLTYLSENSHDNSPTLEKFLSDFGLNKNLSESTTWRWTTHLGFRYDKRKKSYFTNRHESEENHEFCKKFIKE